MNADRTIGLCGYVEPTDEGGDECRASGLRIRVRDHLGHTLFIVRCRKHSDWIEAPTPDPARKGGDK